MNNIYQTIFNVMNELGAIGKDSKSQQGFKYRGVDAVMNALNPLFAKHKLFTVPQVIEQTREERHTSKGGLLISSIVKMKYTFFAEDGTSVEAVVIGEGMDSGDKATNKAMSIAFKYACFQLFCIPTEETNPDADKDVYDVAPKGQTQKEQPAQQKSTTQAPAQNKERTALTTEIVALGAKVGLSAQEVATQYGLNAQTSMARLEAVKKELTQQVMDAEAAAKAPV